MYVLCTRVCSVTVGTMRESVLHRPGHCCCAILFLKIEDIDYRVSAARAGGRCRVLSRVCASRGRAPSLPTYFWNNAVRGDVSLRAPMNNWCRDKINAPGGYRTALRARPQRDKAQATLALLEHICRLTRPRKQRSYSSSAVARGAPPRAASSAPPGRSSPAQHGAGGSAAHKRAQSGER